jgi:Protein of unknown function (DUF2726)
MRKARIIFGSQSEKRAFEAITAQLPEGWTLFPNVPLPQIVEVERNELRTREWDFYLKTSIDFVLTAPSSEPSMALEFDGLGEGFSLGDTYIQAQPTTDRYRSLKLNFKLRLCREVDLPLLIISFEEIRALHPGEARMLVHSIVGQHIAHRVYGETIQRWNAEGHGVGKTLTEREWELAELDSKLQHQYDPFRSGLESGWDEFRRLGVAMSLEPLFEPDVLTALRTGQPFDSVGCRFVARGGKLSSPVIQVVWVRNFAGRELSGVLLPEWSISGGVNPLRVAENVAWYLGQTRALELVDAGDHKPS